jgi:hypothetical protein
MRFVMATGKITKRTLDALQAGAVTGFLWDNELKGFGLKITAGGSPPASAASLPVSLPTSTIQNLGHCM